MAPADRKVIYRYAYRRSPNQDLSEEVAADLDARLVLILANHIGDIAVLNEASALAKHGTG